MRIFCAAVTIALLAGPAYGQSQSVPRYGEVTPPKSASEIQADKAAEKAYNSSLQNIPDRAPADPWGNARSTDATKSATKSAPKAAAAKTTSAKRAKTASTPN
jgi:hypothetical protein